MVYEWIEGALMPVVEKEEKWSMEELEDILREAIDNCCVKCFVANPPYIATTLSGGIDSSFCLFRLRKENSMAEIHTFTIGGSKDHWDINHAEIMADFCKTEHHAIIPEKKDVFWAKKKLSEIRSVSAKEITDGSAAVFLTYRAIADYGFQISIAHDGIDELLGGYPEHRFSPRTKAEKKMNFRKMWNELIPNHLLLLEKSARYFGIKVLFPYLQPEVVEYISHIPVNERTGRQESKIPLRRIAEKYLPREIIERPKKGFCDALKKDMK
jgi:asparagine synthetase B (glutamine-hydrolysing)